MASFPIPPGAVVPDPVECPTVTVEQSARIIGISRNSAYDAITKGEIPSIRIGRRLLVPTAALRRMLGIDTDPTSAA